MTDFQVLDHDSSGIHATEYAGFWNRFVAFLIDSMMVGIVSYTLAIVLYMDISNSTPYQGFSFLIQWIYFAYMESSQRQATFGKMALGIKVTNMNGERIGFAQATGRHFAKILSALILLIGFIMAAFTEKKQALHDILADTLVVKK
jgi:uncharacterized RDD family membrane protein YckC